MTTVNPIFCREGVKAQEVLQGMGERVEGDRWMETGSLPKFNQN